MLSYRSNVAGGGVFLETANLLPLNAKVKIQFSISASNLRIIEGCGQVIKIIPPAHDTAGGIIIRFLNLDKRSKELLAKLSKSFV